MDTLIWEFCILLSNLVRLGIWCCLHNALTKPVEFTQLIIDDLYYLKFTFIAFRSTRTNPIILVELQRQYSTSLSSICVWICCDYINITYIRALTTPFLNLFDTICQNVCQICEGIYIINVYLEATFVIPDSGMIEIIIIERFKTPNQTMSDLDIFHNQMGNYYI